MRRIIGLLTLLTLWASFSVSVGVGQTASGESEVIECTSKISSYLRKNLNARLLRMHHNLIEKKGSDLNYPVIFLKNKTYVVASCGEGTFKTIDLAVYDPSGTQVKKQEKSSPTPMLQVKAVETGRYIIRITSPTGPGHVGLMVMSP